MARKQANVEEFNIRLDADLLPEELNPNPVQVRRWFTKNLLQGMWGFIFGWTGRKFRPIAITDAGWLKVAASSVPLEHCTVFRSVAGDTWSAELEFPQAVSRVDVFVWDYGLLLQRKTSLGIYEGDILIPANSMYSFDAISLAVKVKNAVAAQNATYQVVGWY